MNISDLLLFCIFKQAVEIFTLDLRMQSSKVFCNLKLKKVIENNI